MSSTEARTTPRLFVAVAWLAAVWMFAMAAETALPSADAAMPHHPHEFAISLGNAAAIQADHPHVGATSVPTPPDMLTAVLPSRIGTALAAVGLVAAVAAGAGLFVRLFSPAVRGPPTALGVLITGQQTVTRLCISRR